MRLLAAQLALSLVATAPVPAQGAPVADTLTLPTPMREFRAVWVATVDNMDWPSRPGQSTAEQKQELLAIIERVAALKMNAIIFQVRSEADAMYASKYEPWSRYLTGKQGRAPSPAWDPLAFAVAESHQRGIELHAWFNPYRVAYHRDSSRARSHVTRQWPGLVIPYAQYLWLNPGRAESRQIFMRAVMDVVRRYDVDGVHIDDYFYPYPETDARGRTLEFNDARTYRAYRNAGGDLSRSDWRRRNVNVLVRQLYEAVKAEKRRVKVGISPFGIWRPGAPGGTTAGVDQYEELSADPRKWLRDGSLDYVAPQLYWPERPAEQSYSALLSWWVGENARHRHVWPGLALYKLPISGPKKMSPDDIVEEIELTRRNSGATGHIHFSAKQLMDNVDGVADRLARVYSEPALIPPSPWLDKTPPDKPRVRVDSASGHRELQLAPAKGETVWQWIVQSHHGDTWRTALLPGQDRTYILNDGESEADLLSVSAVDRAGNVSAAALLPHPFH